MGLFGDIGNLLSGLSNPFGLPSNGEWNLQTGKWIPKNGSTVTFFVEQKAGQYPGQYSAIDKISDGGGRRIATYEYPYVDGQALADLGKKGERFTLNIKFFGNNYQELFKEFIEGVTNNGDTGTLVHPVRGSIPCRFAEWEFMHDGGEWNAVTIKAVWMEDNTDTIGQTNLLSANTNSLLRTALQTLATVQNTIQSAIFAVGALLALPQSILTGLENDLASIVASFSHLLGQLAATFSSDAQTQSLLASGSTVGGVTNTNSGTVAATPNSPQATLPPVYQVGFSATDQNNILAQKNAFVNSNQVTPQQALYAANQVRSSIAAAIESANTNLGNNAFTIVLQYRLLAIQTQEVTQGCVAAAQVLIKQYTVPFPMTVRMIAYKNNLTADRQNDIVNLNPFLPSINYVPEGTIVTVPAS